MNTVNGFLTTADFTTKFVGFVVRLKKIAWEDGRESDDAKRWSIH